MRIHNNVIPAYVTANILGNDWDPSTIDDLEPKIESSLKQELNSPSIDSEDNTNIDLKDYPQN